MIKLQTYKLPQASTLTKEILTSYIDLFWNDIFKPLHDNNSNIHLMIMCKVNYADSSIGHRTIANLRIINFIDKSLFKKYLVCRLGILTDSYKVNILSEIAFTYIVKEGVSDDNRLLVNEPVYEVKAHAFNNMVLPLTMDPLKYGRFIAKQEYENMTTYVIDNDSNVFFIEVSNNDTVNNIHIKGATDLKWTDVKLTDNLFKRTIGKNILYIKDGEVVVKSKELNAKPFRQVKLDSKLASINNFMCIDIETVKIENKVVPYLICGYSDNNYINSYAENTSIDGVAEMFKNFISQILNNKSVDTIYAHYLSGFDGILLLRHLIAYKGARIEPLLFNGKLISIKFVYTEYVGIKKKTRTITFKDSFLLLPMSLRSLCKAFAVDSIKSYFPFGLSDINYVGELPALDYWSGISPSEYNELPNRKLWSFKDEAIKYCNLDCKCLFDVLVSFNELVFKEFKVNIHASLTLPSLAMRIFKSHYMPKNTIYQLLGRVEADIRESYSGGAVDVYNPAFNNKNISQTDRGNLYYYDVNSLYPTIMRELVMPIGKPTAFEGDIIKVDPSAYGFFYCKITTPSYLEHPILQRKIKTADGIRTIAGLGEWDGWISSMEMTNAIKYGYTFQVIRGYTFNKGYLFKEYVDKMYELRSTYAKDNPLNLIAKLLMNSLYGKFGMKPQHTRVEMYDTSTKEAVRELYDFLELTGECVQDLIELDNHVIIVHQDIDSFVYSEKYDLYHGTEVNIAIASTITAGGRLWMSSLKNIRELKLYYSDTDSVIVNKQLHPDLVGPKLGQFKLEYTINRAVFLAPKVYGLVTSDGESIIKVKGVAKHALKDFTINDLDSLRQKDTKRTFTQEKWFKNIFQGTIEVSDMAYQLKVTTNKREPIYDLDNNFTGTRPYRYDDLINE